MHIFYPFNYFLVGVTHKNTNLFFYHFSRSSPLTLCARSRKSPTPQVTTIVARCHRYNPPSQIPPLFFSLLSLSSYPPMRLTRTATYLHHYRMYHISLSFTLLSLASPPVLPPPPHHATPRRAAPQPPPPHCHPVVDYHALASLSLSPRATG